MKPLRNNRAERGSTMVESALVLLTFLLLLIGTVDFGQLIYFHQSLVERARAAARYGAVNPSDTAGIQNVALYNQSMTPNPPSSVLPGLTSAMISVSNPDANTSSARVVVTISGYQINFFSPYIAQAFNNRPVMVAVSSETQTP